MTRLAGTGVRNYVNGALLVAQFRSPQGVAVYGGIAYLIDNGQYYIRQLSAGKISLNSLN